MESLADIWITGEILSRSYLGIPLLNALIYVGVGLIIGHLIRHILLR